MESNNIIENVKEYYGTQLKSSKDLKTNVCTTQNQIPEDQQKLSENIPLEIKEKYYGCGLIMPNKVEGKNIIDLGCGSGRDCYLLAQLIGSQGSIVGVDMTSQQIDVAHKYLENFKENVKGISKMKFICGSLEELKDCGILPKEFDVAISNCVINLTADKEKVFGNIFEILKDGGELYFSDVYSDRTISKETKKNKLLWGECLSGALYWKTLFDVCECIGFSTPRLVEARHIELNSDIRKELGDVQFISATYRIFKIKVEHKSCMRMRYVGKDSIQFDVLNHFEPNKVYIMDPELYSIVSQSRYKDLFEDLGEEGSQSKNCKINPFLNCVITENSCCQSKCC